MGSIQLGTIFGIRLAVNGSWFFIFALVSWTLAAVQLPQRFPSWPPGLSWAVGVGTSLLFFLCVLLHELAHSVVALRYGVPVRSITLFIFGGVSQIGRDAPRPRVEFLIALAGPLASLGLALLCWGLYLGARGRSEPVAAMAMWLAGINLSLALFNLLPGLPLDGGRVLRSALWFAADDFGWATRMAAAAGQLGAMALLLSGLYLLFAVREGMFSGLWLGLIGWFMYSAASASQQAVGVLESLRGLTVRQVMRTGLELVEASRNLAAFADDHLQRQGQHLFVVVDEGRAVGLIGPAELRKIPAGRWPRLSVREAMARLEAASRVRPDTGADEALRALVEAELHAAVVLVDDEVVGVVTREDLWRAYERRRARP